MPVTADARSAASAAIRCASRDSAPRIIRGEVERDD
jgi:hypothetical protein